MRHELQMILPEIIALRQQIHQHPELRYEEVKTAELIAKTLRSWGYEPETGLAKTGMTAILDSGKPGKTVALRADMDALPIQEETDVPYTSAIKGKMHACGHDGHVATVLAVANVLRKMKSNFVGKIKFIFQPAEEGGNGADAMIQAGALKGVDAIFGYHNIPGFPKNKIIVKPHCILAGACVFQIHIAGKGGHSSAPEKAIDPVLVGSSIVQALQSVVSRQISPFDTAVVSVTQFHAGAADNIIPETASLRGTFRFTSEEMSVFLKEKMRQIATQMALAFGAIATVEFSSTTPATINNVREAGRVKEVAMRVLGQDSVIDMEHNLMATEDFSFYLNQIPGCFFLVGTGVDKNYLHHPKYIFEDEIIPIAAEVLSSVALDFLSV